MNPDLRRANRKARRSNFFGIKKYLRERVSDFRLDFRKPEEYPYNP
jgi:hypothetical protein